MTAEEFEDIRERLEAVAGVDWGSKPRSRPDEEFHGDWLQVGPAMIRRPYDPGPEDLEDVEEAEAAAEFIRHAATDIRRLLDAIESPKPSE